MLTPREALEVIERTANRRISLDTLYGWIKNKKLPVRKLGGMVLISPSDLDFFLADLLKTN